jgi:hypothetical protein
VLPPLILLKSPAPKSLIHTAKAANRTSGLCLLKAVVGAKPTLAAINREAFFPAGADNADTRLGVRIGLSMGSGNEGR